jgi:hypothetical protein
MLMAKKFLLLSDTCSGGPSTEVFDTEEERERAKTGLTLDVCDSVYYIDIDLNTLATDTWIPNIEDGIPLVEDDCPMDGDAESALASCGWGTDEDYGDFGGDGDL